ncbi:MAG: hypothetical protein ACE5FU_09640 [Nitrospinota bacterium]
MNEMKVAIIGSKGEGKNELIKNLTKNATNVAFNGMHAGIDIGYTTSNGKKVYLFGASSEERKRFFEEVIPAGIDLGVVIVDSSKGISKKDQSVIEEVKGRNLPCMLFLNDAKESEFHSFGKNVVHASAENSVSVNKFLKFLTKTN